MIRSPNHHCARIASEGKAGAARGRMHFLLPAAALALGAAIIASDAQAQQAAPYERITPAGGALRPIEILNRDAGRGAFASPYRGTPDSVTLLRSRFRLSYSRVGGLDISPARLSTVASPLRPYAPGFLVPD